MTNNIHKGEHMDTQILAKIRKANILTPDELTELEGKLVPVPTVDAKTPKGEVTPIENAPTLPAETKVETPKDIVPPSPVAPATPKPTEALLESATKGGAVAPTGSVSTPETPEVPEVAEGVDKPTPDAPTETPEVPTDNPTDPTPEPNQVGTGDLEQVRTTLKTLETKISNLEEILSKLSVTKEPEEADFGISGKGKTAGGGEPIRDRAAELVKKMGGFSNNY